MLPTSGATPLSRSSSPVIATARAASSDTFAHRPTCIDADMVPSPDPLGQARLLVPTEASGPLSRQEDAARLAALLYTKERDRRIPNCLARPSPMPAGFPCPNPTRSHVFPPNAIKGAAFLKCPRCGTVFDFHPQPSA